MKKWIICILILLLLTVTCASVAQNGIPAELAGRKLSDDELITLANAEPDDLKNAISTVEDAAAWFRLQQISYADGSQFSSGTGKTWYPCVYDILTGRYFGGDNVSLVAAWLLQDDYEGAGAAIVLSRYSGPSAAVLAVPSGEEYCLINLSALIPAARSHFYLTMQDHVTVREPEAFAAVIDPTWQEIGLFTALDKEIVWTESQNTAEDMSREARFADPPDGWHLRAENAQEQYASVQEQTVSVSLPEVLAGRKLSDDELIILANAQPADLKNAISTVEDAAAWFRLQQISYADGSQSSDRTAEKNWYPCVKDILAYRCFGGDNVSLVAAWLLQDDYEGAGAAIMLSRYCGPSAAVLAIPKGEEYYLINLSAFIPAARSHFRPAMPDHVIVGEPEAFTAVIDPTWQEIGLFTNLDTEIVWTESQDMAEDMSREARFADPPNGWHYRTDNMMEPFASAQHAKKQYASIPEQTVNISLPNPERSVPNEELLTSMGITLLDDTSVPEVLAGRKLKDSELKALKFKNPEQLKKKIGTVEDAIAWLRMQNFSYWDGAWIANSPYSYLTYYSSAANMMDGPNGMGVFLGRDSISMFVAWLLQDDYENCGAILMLTPPGGSYRNTSSLCIRLDSRYYILNIGALMDAEGFMNTNRDSGLLNAITTDDLSHIPEYIEAFADSIRLEYCDIALITDLTVPTYYDAYGPYADFRDKEQVTMLFDQPANVSIGDWIVANGANGMSWVVNDFDLAALNVPAMLGKPVLTDEEILSLIGQDVDEVADAVTCLPDLIRYMQAADVTFGGIDSWQDDAKDKNITWHFNKTARTANAVRYIGCGSTANLVRRLLDGDYIEVGYVCHTYRNGEGGGHVYNYIRNDQKIYILDMTQLTGSGYTNSNYFMELNNLQEYADNAAQMYGYLPVVYSYSAPEEIPLAWGKRGNDGCSVTWYPTGSELNIIREDTESGYSVAYRDMPEKTAAAIAEAKTDYRNNPGYYRTDTFPGIKKYGFPKEFGEPTMTYEEMQTLVWRVDLDTLTEKIRTVRLMMYFYASGFRGGARDVHADGEDGIIWHFNDYAERVIRTDDPACGQCAALTRYLLDGDYDEVGYVACTWPEGQGGGHIFNYLKIGDKYYALDMNQYDDNENKPARKHFIEIGKDLAQFKSKYRQLFSGEMSVCYTSRLMREIPVGWSIQDGCYISYLPEKYQDDVNILWESPKKGYTYSYVPVGEELLAYMDKVRVR